MMQYGAGLGVATLLPDFDFETYSEAGRAYDEEAGKWRMLEGTPKGTTNPLAAVGAPAYAEHPTTELLSLAYDLKDGKGPRLWVPALPPPVELFEYLQGGGLIEAHNSGFEAYIWQYVCVGRMGWPAFNFDQLRCSMAKCRAWSIPASLADAGDYLRVPVQKDADGKRLLKKFSQPRNPTKTDARLRIRPEEDAVDGPRIYSYNVDDIRAEEGVSIRVPDLSPAELDMWLLDQRINRRGVYIDRPHLDDCVHLIREAGALFEAELSQITGGAVKSGSEVAKMSGFLAGLGVQLPDLTADTVAAALKRDDLPPVARRVVEIRAALSSSSVKKVYAIQRRLTSDGRLKDIFAYAGADRTARWAGRGPQPQNLPSSGPAVDCCGGCGRHQARGLDVCRWCGTGAEFLYAVEWSIAAVRDALAVAELRDARTMAYYFGDTFKAVSGCLRGLFMAAPEHEFICSDFSAIEAVVLAALAGETWRLEVFRTHGKIYEESASRICGIPFEEFLRHKEETGEHHPMRKKVGKVAELASGFGGWVGAWKAFGADKHVGDDRAIRDAILAWRAASPNIVEFWGGQVRETAPQSWDFVHEYYGLEGCAIQAVLNVGQTYSHNGLSFGVKDDVLYVRLLSGRFLQYHKPRLIQVECRRSKLPVYQLSYMGRNQTTGKWVRLETYGGKLTENVVQATARDIMAEALKRVEGGGYPVVLHVHDEIVSEVKKGHGSVEEFEALMSQCPSWCAGWPIKAAGGWRDDRYQKD